METSPGILPTDSAGPSQLPAYSESTPLLVSLREPVVHTYTTPNSDSRPWATLRIQSDASSPQNLPSIFQGRPIVGSVDLDLQKETSVKFVRISVIGEIITSMNDTSTFLHLSEQLWPHHPTSATDQHDRQHAKKLRGEFSWPFSIHLPEQLKVYSTATGSEEAYLLPPTFSERWDRVTINYRLQACIGRGRLRGDRLLGTRFVFTPTTQPPLPSTARQLAYQENCPLIGPEGDPDGWHSLAPLTINGTIFNARRVEPKYILSLAKPLSYTRGSVVPLSISIQTEDLQALDLLSVPSAIVVRLRRHVAMTSDSLGARSMLAPTMEYHERSSTVQAAAWWPPAYSNATATKRTLDGEIHLPRTLDPSCELGNFKIWYTISIYQMNAIAFAPANNSEKPLQSESVEIVTAYAPGPRPRSYSPPSYESSPIQDFPFIVPI